MTVEGTLTIEDARLIFRNFAGKEGQYNREGDRNVCVILPDDIAKQMEVDGWNIKYLSAREEDAAPTPYLHVTVGYKGRPPKIFLINSRGRTAVDEEMVEMLDWVDIKTADLIVRPYNWEVNGNRGVKAYLASLYVTINEDDLELKYAELDQLPARAGRVEERE